MLRLAYHFVYNRLVVGGNGGVKFIMSYKKSFSKSRKSSSVICKKGLFAEKIEQKSLAEAAALALADENSLSKNVCSHRTLFFPLHCFSLLFCSLLSSINLLHLTLEQK